MIELIMITMIIMRKRRKQEQGFPGKVSEALLRCRIKVYRVSRP